MTEDPPAVTPNKPKPRGQQDSILEFKESVRH